MWVFENQFHRWLGFSNWRVDSHEYVLDWLSTILLARGSHRITGVSLISGRADGPFGECDWTPPILPGQAYF